MSSRIVLGRGLDALIPNKGQKDSDKSGDKKLQMVATEKIQPNPMQPRRMFNDESMNELANSFKQNGIMQPLVVTQADDKFTIVAGERRYRAAKLAGIAEVPVILIEDTDDTRRLELALVENIQRENLNPIELANAYKSLLEKCGLSHDQLSERVNKSRTAVTNSMRLLNLPVSVQILVRDGKITEGHARAILSLATEKEMLDMADRIIKGTMTVRDVEEQTRKNKKRRLIPKRQIPMINEYENSLRQILGTSVKINHGLKRGKIEIEYYGNEDLERIVALLKKGN
jgi:ParB family chromosome partitioning protein